MRNYANEVDAFDCAVPEAWWRAATLEAVLSALYTFISGLAYVEIAGGNGFGSGVSGLAMAGLIYVGLEISGGQINPAITIGVWTTGVINVFRMLTYVVFQFLGAFVGALLLWGAVGTGGKKDPWNLGAASEIREADLNNESYNEANAFVHSTLATFLLVLTYYVTVVVHNKTYNPVGPLMVGLVNWALLATGTAVQAVHMNPARTVALAAISNEMDDIWMFIIAPIVGAIIACVVYRYLFQEVNEAAKIVERDVAVGSRTVAFESETYDYSTSSYFY